MQAEAHFTVDFAHRLRFVIDALNPANDELANLLALGGEKPAQVLFFVDTGVVRGRPDVAAQIKRYVAAHRSVMAPAGEPEIVPGGERAKNMPQVLAGILWRINEARLCRQSFIVVIGGGAVLDVVGYAAATAHRGMRLIRLPTTTLAQADSGVGVKNSVNAFGKKNFLGTFAVPWAVVNDASFLPPLLDQEWRAGFSEAVKVGLVKDAELFARVEEQAARLRQRDMAAALPIIERSARLHLEHIVRGGDPFEMTAARPLDFGHWAAHKLEQMTNFTLPHGQAVAVGMALDVNYSHLAGLLAKEEARRILACLRELGLPTYHQAMSNVPMLLEGLAEFREHLGGRLTIMLLRGIGRPVEAHEMDAKLVAAAAQASATGD